MYWLIVIEKKLFNWLKNAKKRNIRVINDPKEETLCQYLDPTRTQHLRLNKFLKDLNPRKLALNKGNVFH